MYAINEALSTTR